MSFTSAVVAESHYQGKIHAKRLKLLLGEQPALKATGRCRGAGAEGVGAWPRGWLGVCRQKMGTRWKAELAEAAVHFCCCHNNL